MKLSPDQLARQARSGKLAPVYFFIGDDDYRMQEGAQYLINEFLPDALRLSNSSKIDLNSAKVDKLLDALSALPFFGERTALVVIEPQKLSPKQLGAVLSFLTPEVSERLVIFIIRAANKPKKSAAVYKKLTAVSTFVEFPRLKSNDAARKVGRIFKEAEITASPAVINEIVEIVGADLGRLLSETEKIRAYVGPGAEVSIETVRRLCSAGAAKSVYQLVDRIVAGDTSGALEALAPLLKAGESGGGILYWIGAHYLDLYLVKGARRLPPYKKPWYIAKLKSQSRDVTFEELERAISIIGSVEALFKGGVGDSLRQRGTDKSDSEALTELTLRLCDLRQSPSKLIAS